MTEPSPACLSMIERLVAIDTTSHRSNLEAIALIRGRLEALGADCRLTSDDSGTKANLYATLGPSGQSGILLSGHTDVVPAEGQEWASDPFRLTRRGDRLYGRGSADMKSFIGLVVALLPEFVARGLTVPLHVSFTYDEELGCIGVRRLLADLETLPVKPRLCILGEPTEMKVVSGHKGKRGVTCRVHGKEGHSALGQGVNAVEAAAEMIVKIRAMQQRIVRDGPFDGAYAPPYTTLHTGVVQGGRALNIVPAECAFDYEIRALPKDDADRLETEIRAFARDRIEPGMKATDPHCGISFETINDTPGFELADDHEVVRLVAELSGDNGCGRVSFGTEAGLFTTAGVPAVVCGPGSITQAHKPDEYIEIDQIVRGEAFLRRLMERVCRP